MLGKMNWKAELFTPRDASGFAPDDYILKRMDKAPDFSWLEVEILFSWGFVLKCDSVAGVHAV
jgi:hypothetical protein